MAIISFMRLVAFIALSLLLVSGCGPTGSGHVRPDPALLTLVPEDTVLLIGARLDHIRETAVYQRHMTAQVDPALADFIEWSGVDPRKDIWEVLAASNGAGAVIMTRGKFSTTGLEPRVEMEGATRSSYKGYLLVGDGKKAITFMNATTAVMGHPQRLRRIIDQRSESHKPPELLLKKIEAIDRANQIWAVSIGGFAQSGVPQTGNIGNLDRLLRRLRSLTIGANLNGGAVVAATGECASNEDAETLQAALRTLTGLAGMGLRDQPATRALLDTLVITHQQNVVQLNTNISPGLFDQLLKEAHRDGK